MKAIIYTKLVTKELYYSENQRDLEQVKGFQVKKIFKENNAEFTKTSLKRKKLSMALEFMENRDIDCLMVHKISNLGRNITDVYYLIEKIRQKQKNIYIHNIGVKIKPQNSKEDFHSNLIVTLLADLAKLKRKSISHSIKNKDQPIQQEGLVRIKKTKGSERKEYFLAKHLDVVKCIQKGYSYREIQSICNCSRGTIQKIKRCLL